MKIEKLVLFQKARGCNGNPSQTKEKSIMKKRIISIFLIVSIIVSVFAVGIVTTSAASKLPAPTNVVAANTNSGINISWYKVNGADGYFVYYMEAGGSWKRIDVGNSYAGYNRAGCNLNFLSNLTDYFFQVQAYNFVKVKNSSYIKFNTCSKVVHRMRIEPPIIKNYNSKSVCWKAHMIPGWRTQIAFKRAGSKEKFTIQYAECKEDFKSYLKFDKKGTYAIQCRFISTYSGDSSAWSAPYTKTVK